MPAFAGLGAPYWDMYARGAIVGLTGATRREHIARATLEAIAFQTADVLAGMRDEGGVDVPVLRVDGGGTANSFLMQFQSDLLGIPLEVADVQETTARGAAYLAGLGVGFWTHAGRDHAPVAAVAPVRAVDVRGPTRRADDGLAPSD